MSIVLMTANMRKIVEFRRFFARHAQTLLVESATESMETLTTWLQTAKAVLTDESNIFTPDGDLVGAEYVGPARNICRLHAWVLKDNVPVRMSYVRQVKGTFDGAKLRSDDAAVFGWDAAFTPIENVSLHDMATVGLKNSAREHCLSAFTKAFLHHKEHKKLRWQQVEATCIVDWDTDSRWLLTHPLYQRLTPVLRNALSFVIDQGVVFRAAASRRDGNYWFPGLNGGIPYVPKGDPIHEGTYMFHDAMHQLMPDLVFDGVDTPDHRRIYIAYRMMSEAVSLVLADMVFADGLANDPAHQDYDFSKRRIYPLYRAIDRNLRENLYELLWRTVRFVLLGDPMGFPTDTEAWKNFEEKYTRFFVADFQWTRTNWSNLVGRTAMSREWIALIRPETLRAQRVWLVSDVVNKIHRDLPIEKLIAALFQLVWEKRIVPAVSYTGDGGSDDYRSNGFRRWLTGQCAFFARYAPIVAVPPLGHALAERIRDPRPFSEGETVQIREQFRDHVQSMAKKGLISDDDAAMFPDLFPLFDPFFLKDYDRAKQEFSTVAEASAVAFA